VHTGELIVPSEESLAEAHCMSFEHSGLGRRDGDRAGCVVTAPSRLFVVVHRHEELEERLPSPTIGTFAEILICPDDRTAAIRKQGRPGRRVGLDISDAAADEDNPDEATQRSTERRLRSPRTTRTNENLNTLAHARQQRLIVRRRTAAARAPRAGFG